MFYDSNSLAYFSSESSDASDQCPQQKWNKKLSYRRETARQLRCPHGGGLSPPALSLSTPSGYTYAYGRIRNPQQTYVKRAVRNSVIYVNYNYNENKQITWKNGPLTITITITK